MRANTFPIPIKLDIGMQTALERLTIELGRPDFNPNGLDGVFGRGTRNAVTAFQRDHGLPETPSASHIADVGQDTVNSIVAELDALGISHWP
jgi:peptidoglycan hydrolase-like protein with peptidoglycan-binding domain